MLFLKSEKFYIQGYKLSIYKPPLSTYYNKWEYVYIYSERIRIPNMMFFNKYLTTFGYLKRLKI